MASFDTLFRFAQICARSKNIDRAIRAYEQLLQMETVVHLTEEEVITSFPCRDFRIYFNLAQLYIEKLKATHKPSNSTIPETDYLYHATSLLKEGLLLAPQIMEFYVNLSGLFITHQDFKAALEYSQRGISILLQQSKEEISKDDFNCRSLFTNYNIAMRALHAMPAAIEFTFASMKIEPSTISAMRNQESSCTDYFVNTACCNVILTVVCVKFGKKYDARYVNALYNMMATTLTASYRLRFICFTEDSEGLLPNIEVQSFAIESEGWTGWWKKACVFKSFSTPAKDNTEWTDWWLYCDLDTIILKSIDELWQPIKLLCANQQLTNEQLNTIITLDASKFKNEGNVDTSPPNIYYTVSHCCFFPFLCLVCFQVDRGA